MKILVVDDERISRNVLTKTINPLGEIFAVNNSKKAFSMFKDALDKSEPFDLITLDVSMPGISGLKLLKKIRSKEQIHKIVKADRSKIIMVTSRMNVATVKECIQSGCDGYIAKPVNKYQLFNSLASMGFDLPEKIKINQTDQRQDIVAKIIKRFYQGKIKLPVLPEIVRDIQKMLKQGEPSMDELAKLVEKEVVMSAKLIAIANSSLYKGVDSVSSLKPALVKIGVKEIKSVVSAIASKSLFTSKNKTLKGLLDKLWCHSFATACYSRLIAQKMEIEDAENIFLMSIIHDIGKILLLKSIYDVSPDVDLNDTGIQTAIHEIHTTFGAELLRRWKFSQDFVSIAELHHMNGYTSEMPKNLLIINLADYLVQIIGYGFYSTLKKEIKAKSELRSFIEETDAFKELNIPFEALMEMKDVVKETVKANA